MAAKSDDLFAIDPSGVEGSRDFSFLVIGDPGEGDASQYSLISRYLELGRRDDVKFLVVSSDVIYPAGAIEDYERNFYLPFQGFAKPVYAIPGNHDWYDALEGFNANFLEPKAARAAIEARVEADYGLTSTNARRMDRLVAEAARLRGLYGVDVAHQRAPFFELQTQDFALLAIDTGILRSVDERQWAWLERALDRSQGKFTMAIVGHPRFAGGHDTPPVAEGGNVSDASGNFAALYRLLASRNVKIAMAGDTHDFEYYKEKVGGDGPTRTMHHFVNGGGGAYLSIGTALDFPKQPDVADWAFYPRTDQLRSKMEAEMPLWKEPFWRWITWFNAWPASVEALSGVFDLTTRPSFRASWRCASRDRKGASPLFSTGSKVHCTGGTCKLVGTYCRQGLCSTTRSNSWCQWIATECGNPAFTSGDTASCTTGRIPRGFLPPRWTLQKRRSSF